ncbi:MAG TPA: hypothetical protein VJR27_01215 [Candidatus Saccharimonadales bacterium]|nr:hypothetical protein [Candidatus Saccharimonadales bacterium]
MNEMTNNPSERGVLSLVLGVDGSGKSTFLQGLQNRFGAKILEPTSTPEVRAFKKANLNTPIDSDFVDRREQLFLNLNRRFDGDVNSLLRQDKDVATTGNGLVTLISHALMRIVVGEKPSLEIDRAINTWLEGDMLKPDHITLVHAPDKVIMERIQDRQKQGNELERFWGFNAPYFLSRYQDTWLQATNTITQNSGIPTLQLDSSQLQTMTMLDAYEQQQ